MLLDTNMYTEKADCQLSCLSLPRLYFLPMLLKLIILCIAGRPFSLGHSRFRSSFQGMRLHRACICFYAPPLGCLSESHLNLVTIKIYRRSISEIDAGDPYFIWPGQCRPMARINEYQHCLAAVNFLPLEPLLKGILALFRSAADSQASHSCEWQQCRIWQAGQAANRHGSCNWRSWQGSRRVPREGNIALMSLNSKGSFT